VKARPDISASRKWTSLQSGVSPERSQTVIKPLKAAKSHSHFKTLPELGKQVGCHLSDLCAQVLKNHSVTTPEMFTVSTKMLSS
jgi:hypothetical protein